MNEATNFLRAMDRNEKIKDLEIGKIYIVDLNSHQIPVKIISEAEYYGWWGYTLFEDRRVYIKSINQIIKKC